ncbi:MAG: PQQ-like beta-propeller repeat protein [Planctomycetia bacterium]|nr:PQQ-like beta-propeller repeat protein [Planctomycetia bacterium]
MRDSSATGVASYRSIRCAPRAIVSRPFACLCLVAVLGCSRAPAEPAARSAHAQTVAAPSTVSPTPAAAVPDASSPAAALSDLGTRKQGDDWLCFLGPTANSRSRERGIITDWRRGALRVVWHERAGTGYGMPVISRGRLFQFSRFADKARLTCQKSETGELLWTFEYPTDYEDLYNYDNGPRCCPVVDDDRVYTFGAEGMLHCVRAADGHLVWKVDTTKEFGVVQNFFGVGSTPIVEGDLVICQVGGSTDDTRDVPPGQLDRVRGKDSGVVAFDKFTGQMRYKTSDELASYAGPVAATIAGRRYCFVFARGGLLAFNPADGKIDFHFPWRASILESVNASNPVVVDDLVLISETYGPGSALLQARPGGYDVVWSDKDRRRDKSLQTHWNTPVYHDGYVYGSSGRHSNEAELRCVELRTGKVMWSQPGLTRSSLLYVDGHFVVLAETGDLLLTKATPEKFDLVTGVALTLPDEGEKIPGAGPRRLITPPAWAAPILSHGLMYVRGRDRLVCLELIPEKESAASE